MHTHELARYKYDVRPYGFGSSAMYSCLLTTSLLVAASMQPAYVASKKTSDDTTYAYWLIISPESSPAST